MDPTAQPVPVRQWRRWLTLVLVGLGMLFFDLRVNDVDLLPDLGGRLVLLAAGLVVPRTRSLVRLRALAVLAAVVGVVLDAVERLGPDVAVAAGLADDALVLSTVALAIRLAADLQLESRRRELIRGAALFAVVAVPATAGQLVELPFVLSVLVGMAALAVLLVLLVLLLLLRRDLRSSISAEDSAAVSEPAW